MSKLPPRVIPLSALRVGMHVIKLDISWLASPFISHNRKIKNLNDIELLKKSGVRNVTIDPNRGLNFDEIESSYALRPPDSLQPSSPPDPASPEKLLHQELSAAKKIRDEVTRAVDELHRELNAGNRISTESIAPHIEHTLASLRRNNQALLNLAHISARSQKINDHTFSTFCIALNLAQILDYSDDDIEALGIAALVHEVGWTQIPIHLMGKLTRYNPTEKKLVEKHTEIALKTLSQCSFPATSLRIVAEHHELCDGQGYPYKLHSAQIHPLSKLFAVVDHYDALVHQLVDMPGMLPATAIKQLHSGAEKKAYDQAMVAQLISLLGIYPVSSAVKLNDGSLGLVRCVPPNDHLRPLVEIRIDASGKVLDTPTFIDLASEHAQREEITIDSVIDPKSYPNKISHRLSFDI